jgi:hypothetical protein
MATAIQVVGPTGLPNSQIVTAFNSYTASKNHYEIIVTKPNVTVTFPSNPDEGEIHIVVATNGDVTLSGGINPKTHLPIPIQETNVPNGTGIQMMWSNTPDGWVCTGRGKSDKDDAVIFDGGSPAENVRTNRATVQSPINNTLEGIVNMSSDTSGVSSGATGNFSTISGGDQNTVQSDYTTCGGGLNNGIFGPGSTIAGGENNSASGTSDTIGGGITNNILGDFGTIGGGQNNTEAGSSSFIGGGQNNNCQGDFNTIAGGNTNATFGTASCILGGQNNQALFDNTCVVGGNANNALALNACIGAGSNNNITNTGTKAFIGAGSSNEVQGANGCIGAGVNNLASSMNAFVGAGTGNVASGENSSVPGGAQCVASGSYSHATGNGAQAIGVAASATGINSNALRAGQRANASGGVGFAPSGDAQESNIPMQGTTPGNGAGESVELTIGGDPGFILEDDKGYSLLLNIVAKGNILGSPCVFSKLVMVACRRTAGVSTIPVGGITNLALQGDAVAIALGAWSVTVATAIVPDRIAVTFNTGSTTSAVTVTCQVLWPEALAY